MCKIRDIISGAARDNECVKLCVYCENNYSSRKDRPINIENDSKNLCENYEKNINKDCVLIDYFCKHYTGMKYTIESCSERCSLKINR